ncbi:MAG: hypothetical protein ACON4O_04480 [Lentimonas sp.]
MKKAQKTIAFILAASFIVLALSGCSSIRTENGVTIQKERSYKFW